MVLYLGKVIALYEFLKEAVFFKISTKLYILNEK